MKKELAIKIFSELLEELEMNPKQLSDSLGKERPQWAYDILNEKVKVGISKNIADLICEKYPQINKSWLLTGEGEKLNNAKNYNSETLPPTVPYEFVQAMIDERKRHDEMNAELIRQNGELIDMLQERKKTSAHMESAVECADANGSGLEK